ncbi:hypothetical protein FLM9_1030 [Candidatus Synechococcus spongiarum]|uniref:Uncharacterized protein n=1 Tax=Candidatus Synechococcus spongiarum TaxID=431041 RepID=A0A171DGW0_9SYNE|nr:hypothetical protein FLM9_1030 [Candidatus Synechococcus spongiarum]
MRGPLKLDLVVWRVAIVVALPPGHVEGECKGLRLVFGQVLQTPANGIGSLGLMSHLGRVAHDGQRESSKAPLVFSSPCQAWTKQS